MSLQFPLPLREGLGEGDEFAIPYINTRTERSSTTFGPVRFREPLGSQNKPLKAN